MLLPLIIFLTLLFSIIIIFSFPQFSPIPYFPTNKKDLPLIIKALNLKDNQTVIDLGAGDGIVIFEAGRHAFQKKLNTQFVAIDINPVLILIMHLRRLFHPNKKNIKIIWADLFNINFINFMNFKNFITIYLYVSPWLIEKIVKSVKRQIKHFNLVSYYYPVRSLKPISTTQGEHPVFKYRV